MEFFAWPQVPIESYSADLHHITPLWIPDAQNNACQWGENRSINYSQYPQAFGDSASNSPESFQGSESFHGSSYADSSFDGSPQEPLLDFDIPNDVKAVGRPRAPVINGRDPNENRIQRRRTQNRNSQRVYRQRRVEERNLFEARAAVAEETSAKLKIKVDLLNSEIAELTGQVQKLQIENAELRTCKKSKGGEVEA